MTILTDENFESEVLKADLPVLVDFYADWCGPCQMLRPIIEELSEESQGKAKIAKINVDEAPKTAEKYGIMSIPTVILFKEGKEVTRQTGLTTKEVLKELISHP
ncbi:MAG: thioredoxin [Patescibacteria group bacterium]|nr:thioredoxin [Patescibacteria group bacterium]MCL5095702.1 thioredoxin [Patescibacteria group bacterium]